MEDQNNHQTMDSVSPSIPPTPTSKRGIPPVLFIIFGLLIFIVIVFILLKIGLNLMARSSPTPSPTPEPTATPVVSIVPLPVSKYASDSGLLKIQSDLKSLGAQIDSVDLFDTQISPPNIDLNIHIK